VRVTLVDRLDPVLLRELRTTVRPAAFGRVLVLAAAAVAGVVLVAALATSGDGRAAAVVGRTLFHTYFVSAFALVSVVSAVLGAGAIARDAESGMLEAIGLTHLSPIRYLSGKVAALWLVVAALLAATAPAAAVPLLWGGVSPLELVTGMMILGVVALLGVATGVAVATRLQVARWSIALSVAVAGPAAAVSLALLFSLRSAAESSWNVPADGLFWFASIPLVGLGPDQLVLAVLLPVAVVATVLGYLGVLALGALTPSDGRARRALEGWLVGSLLALVACAAAARARLPFEASRHFAALAILIAGLLGLVALVTRLGPPPSGIDGRSEGSVRGVLGLVLLTGAGAALVALVPNFFLPQAGAPPRVESLGHIALHVWSFVVLHAGFGAAVQAALGRRGSPRVPVLAAVVLVGLAGFLADVVRPGSSLLHASFAARLSPLYAQWAVAPDRTVLLLQPAGIALGLGIFGMAVAGFIGWTRARRAASLSLGHEPG
jgi:hypothetical protein